MEQLETFFIFTERLEKAGLKYMATGSVAAMVYGYPRFTADLDVVVELSPSRIDAVLKAFPLEEFYCPPRDVLLIESKRRQRGHFNIISHETGRNMCLISEVVCVRICSRLDSPWCLGQRSR